MCKDFFLEECVVHGAPEFRADTQVAMGVPNRAKLTLPAGLEIRESLIPGAGLGVFICEKFLDKGIHFGPYEGDMTDKDNAAESGYSWEVGISVTKSSVKRLIRCCFLF